MDSTNASLNENELKTSVTEAISEEQQTMQETKKDICSSNQNESITSVPALDKENTIGEIDTPQNDPEDESTLSAAPSNNDSLSSDAHLEKEEGLTIIDTKSVTEIEFNESKCDSDLSTLETAEESFNEPEVKPPAKKRGRKRLGIYDKNLDKETLLQKRKKRALDLRLQNLKWTLNQSSSSNGGGSNNNNNNNSASEVVGKRMKKAPDRFELAIMNRRKTSMDEGEGSGDQLGSIPWIAVHLRDADTSTLRMLHRIIFRRQGMFSEKHIKRGIALFRGFPFEYSSPDIKNRRMPMEKAPTHILKRICDILGIKTSDKNIMINTILKFLQHPTQAKVEEFLQDTTYLKNRQRELKDLYRTQFPTGLNMPTLNFNVNSFNMDENSNTPTPEVACQVYSPQESAFLALPWIKPSYFTEGKGTKLKCFKPIVANVQAATHNFIEMLHRLLFMFVENNNLMRRNVLEFSGFKCVVGSPDYIYRNKLLYALPLSQLKLICHVLCLPTWHRSRQYLIDGILNFLTSPCLSAMKKTVPAPVPSQDSSPNLMDLQKKEEPINIKIETEEIEIVPDIHFPDEDFLRHPTDFLSEDFQEVKLKNFPNIHYQVISTPANKLNDLHVILYGKPCPLNNVRKSILEFTQFQFDENSFEYQSRKTLLEQMSLESLIMIVTVLSLTAYVVDLSRVNIIEAVLKFLLRPSALLNCEDQSTPAHSNEGVKNICLDNVNDLKDLKLLGKTGEITIQPIKAPQVGKKTPIAKPKDGANKRKSQPPVKVVSTDSAMSITVKKEPGEISNIELDEPLAKVRKISQSVSLKEDLDSDDNDDEPLSKFVGHPSDEQLRFLVTKVIKESTLDSITMKHVIKIVYNTYPNYDLCYRKEFIKSVVRQILSQMEDARCSVSTTVFTF